MTTSTDQGSRPVHGEIGVTGSVALSAGATGEQTLVGRTETDPSANAILKELKKITALLCILTEVNDPSGLEDTYG